VQVDDALSDLANCCEYLTIDKSCSVISDNEKAKANRQIRCQNDEKISCCYNCQSRPECDIKCTFLGNSENKPSRIEPEKTEAKTTSKIKENAEINQIEKAPVACSFCNIEMSHAKTKFKIDDWEGPPPKLSADGLSKFGQELPITIYCCPRCGKIEFRADNSEASK
jgi:hypothetical protein